MRTTLKRGIGRGAGADGNGRGVLPPEVEPPRPTAVPIVRYRQPPPPRRGVAHVLAKGLVWLLIGAVTVAAGLLGGGYLYLDDTVSEVVAHTPEVEVASERLDVPLPGQPAIALALGYDRRAGVEGEANGSRSDTVMLLRADPEKNAVSMLSLPRDLFVDVHCPGQSVFRARINAAYEQCGVTGTLETVRALTGLPINYLLTVNFRGFKQLVAQVGGVWTDVDRRYYNPPGTGYAAIDLQPGYQKLQGQAALDFVRYRHTDSDLYRVARQQLFLKAFKQQVAAIFEPLALPRLVNLVTQNVEVGRGGGEQLSVRELLSYALFLYQLPAGHFFQTKIENLQDDASFNVIASQEELDAAIDRFVNPDTEAPEKATAVAIGIKPKTKVPPPSETTLVVLNGNGVAGAAADTSYQLAQRGYRTLEPPNGQIANAPTGLDFTRSKVYYDPLREGAEPAAERLAAILGTPGTVDVDPVPVEVEPLRGEAMLVAVVGESYSGTIGGAPVDETPERQEPEVTENPGLTEELLRQHRAEVPFPVLVPAVIERYSRLDPEMPIRVYSIAGRPTLRLTFATGAAEYWGIQMIRWNGAPALRQPNRKLHLKGRVYELHYNGPKLHMVVVRDEGTSYWVVNTLLNKLSNETMLAIARGLRPLSG